MRALLVAMTKELAGVELPLPRDGEVVLGRSEDATLTLTDNSVSRQHCKVAFADGLYVIEDLGSMNGTLVNGRKVKRAILFHSDSILVGNQEFRFELEGDLTESEATLAVEDEHPEAFATEVKEKVAPDISSSVWFSVTGGEEGTQVREELATDLSAICRVSQVVNAESDIEHLFEVVADNVMRVSEADRGYLIVAREPGGAIMPLVCRYKEGIPEQARNSFSRSIVRECYANGCSILMADPMQEKTAPADSIFMQQIHSTVSCACPWCTRGDVWAWCTWTKWSARRSLQGGT